VGARSFVACTRIARPPEMVFEWVADHRNAPRVLEGVTRWRPLTDQVRGQGARFEVEMRALGLPLANVLEIDRWAPPRSIGWRSLEGPIEQAGCWRFAPVSGGTEVTLTIDYRPPGGVLGAALMARLDGLVRGRLERGLERMRLALESDR
jgi:uncharacterized membrane protein